MLQVATNSDIEGILEIYGPIVSNTPISFEYEIPSIKEMQSRVLATLEKYPYLVSMSDDGIVTGFAYATRFRGRPAYDWIAELSVYVHQDYRNKGIANRLYKSLFNILEVQYVCQVIGVIALPNEISVAFHNGLGFRHVGTVDSAGYKFNQWHSIAFFQKELSKNGGKENFIPFSKISENMRRDLLTTQ